MIHRSPRPAKCLHSIPGKAGATELYYIRYLLISTEIAQHIII